MQTNVEICHFIQGLKRMDKLRKLASEAESTSAEITAEGARPLEPPPLMGFLQKLDGMADEIDTVVQSAKETRLYHWWYWWHREDYDGDVDTGKVRHPLFEKLDMFGSDKCFMEDKSEAWRSSQLHMFSAWVTVRYAGLVTVKIDVPYDEDLAYGDGDYYIVDLKWV